MRDDQASRWESVKWDLAYAARGLRLRPGFAAVVAGTLALGIAANAIMFGVVDRLLLRPPSGVTDPDRVIRIYYRARSPRVPGHSYTTTSVTTFPTITTLQRDVPSLAEVSALSTAPRTLGRGLQAREIDVSQVSGNYFHLLGTRPALGRFFAPDEDRPPVGANVAVVSHDFWRRHFAGARSAIGAELLIGHLPFTVIGVAPKGFTGVDLENVDAWVPVSTLAVGDFDGNWHSDANVWWLRAIARLAPGVAPERAASEATLVYRRLVQSWNYPWADSMPTVVVGPIIEARGPEETPLAARVSLWLSGVSAVVLLIACANIANLLLARAAQRRREIAVRLALGIGRARLVRQLLIESLLLALCAAALALVLAHWGGQLVRTLLLPDVAWGGSPLDLRVLGFTAVVTLVTGVIAGLAPALQASKPDVAGALKAGAREGGGRRSTLRAALLVTQAALSVVLLVGAGLFVRSLRHVRSLDVGVDLDRVLIAHMGLHRAGFDSLHAASIWKSAYERVRRIPSVEHAALVTGTVPTYGGSGASIRIPGRDSLPEMSRGVPYYSGVTPDFLATLGTRLVRGRGITDADVAARARVAVVNEEMVKRYWPSANPIGECFFMGNDETCTEVVGVVENVIMFRMLDDVRSQFYVPRTHPFVDHYWRVGEAILVRARGEARGVAELVRREIQGLAPGMPYVTARPLEEVVAPELRPRRLGAAMFAVFGALALAIAAVGLYGVVAYTVSQRTQEMGVRMALGARREDVIRLVVLGGMRVVALGLALGIIVALAAGRWVQPLLYDISPRDAATFATAALTLAVAALLASLIPALRASRVDPVVALRAD